MPCTNPLTAYLPASFDFEGKRKLIFSERKIYEFKRSTVLKLQKFGLLPEYKYDENFNLLYDEKNKFPEIYHSDNTTLEPDGYIIQIPCGKCQGCKLDYSRRWATRAVNEASLYNHYQNCAFVSLTFNEEALRNTNLGYSVDKAFFRSFIKRLRFYVKQEYGVEFRYMSCGEYGAKRLRPHYHMIIFGFNFPDKYIFKREMKYGKMITYYRSPFLERLWHLPNHSESAGFSLIGDVNFETCAYVARYVTKKTHNKSDYGDKEPEFLLTSRMPGLGSEYCSKYLDTIFGNGYVVLPDGNKSPVPRYYENVCEKQKPELFYNYKYEKFVRLCKEMLSKFKLGKNDTKKRYDALDELTSIRSNRLVRNYEFDFFCQPCYIIYIIKTSRLI